jgi:hypothetical protein
MKPFFNALFKKIGINQEVTEEQTIDAIKNIDKNFDGKIDRN